MWRKLWKKKLTNKSYKAREKKKRLGKKTRAQQKKAKKTTAVQKVFDPKKWFAAAKTKNLPTLKKLLKDKKYYLHLKDSSKNRNTALIIAGAVNGDVSTAKFLLKNGADVEKCSEHAS